MPEATPVQAWLRSAATRLADAGYSAARLEARVLAGHVLSIPAAQVGICELTLDPTRLAIVERLLARRLRGEPIQYVTGEAEFWSLPLAVSSAVLVPRPETEHLVELAVDYLRAGRGAGNRRLKVADLGTGSGAIAIAVAKELPDVEVYATDISPAALAVAAANARRHRVDSRVTFLHGHWCEPLLEPAGHVPFFDAVLSNPPYISRSEAAGLPADVREYEPAVAMFADDGGLAAYRHIVGRVVPLLRPGALLALEIAPHLAAAVVDLVSATGAFRGVSVRHDYAGRKRLVYGFRSAQSLNCCRQGVS